MRFYIHLEIIICRHLFFLNDVGKDWRNINLPEPKQMGESSPGKTTVSPGSSNSKQRKSSESLSRGSSMAFLADGEGTPIGKKQCTLNRDQDDSDEQARFESDADSDEESG